MKKVFVIIFTFVSCGLLTGCGGFGAAPGTAGGNQPTQNGNADILGAILNGGQNGTASVIGDIISTIAGNILTSKATLVGTWMYTQPCVQFESENLLAKAGGSVIASQAEAKLDQYYQKLGIRPGACRFVFSNDNTLQYTVGNTTRTGSYSFNSQNNTVIITTQMGQNVTAYVSISGASMGLTFDASKLLTLIGNAQQVSSSLSSISQIASNYTGMKLGFQFTRQ